MQVLVGFRRYIQVLGENDTLGPFKHTFHVMFLLISCHWILTWLLPYAHTLNTDDLSFFLALSICRSND